MPPKSRAAGSSKHLTKSQRLDKMARKKDERAVRTAHRREQQARKALGDEHYAAIDTQLAKLGLQIRDIPGDGNCLFRALGDQLEGHGRHHLKHRHDVVEYMLAHKADFEPFVEDDVPFDRHMAMLKKSGTYAGNDAIVAFSRLQKKNIIIHQQGSPVWQVRGSDKSTADQLHISYHNGDHYSSVRKIGDHLEAPSNIRINDLGSGLTNGSSSVGGGGSKSSKHSKSTNGWESYQTCDFHYEDVESGLCAVDVASSSDVDGVARAFRGTSDIEQSVIQATGCLDHNLVEQALVECGYDVDQTISYILHLQTLSSSPTAGSSMNGGLWDEDGTGSRLFGSTSSGPTPDAKPKRVSASQRKRDRKLEKKARKSERNRNLVNWSSSESDDATVITQGVNALQI